MNNIFLKVDGIHGESRDSTHIGWIDVDAYSWGITRREGNNSASSNYRNLSVHCHMDKGTPAMMLKASGSNKISNIVLSACKAGGEQFEYYKITLENVLINKVILRDNGDITDVEYEFQAEKVKLQYWEQVSTGIKGAETRMGWDIKNSTYCY